MSEKPLKNDYLEVMQAIYYDACVKCAAKVSNKDLKTIRSRVEDQGLSFLTIALPAFCSDFERSLELGHFDSKSFQNFRKFRRGPAFLRDLISQVFNYETGRIYDEVSNHPSRRHADLIASVRQICLAFKKIKLPCSREREYRAVRGFIANERAFSMFPLPKEDDEFFKLTSSVLWDNIMGGLRLDMLVPKHGPGATAERISGNQKYRWRYWHERLEPYFPLLDNAYSASCGEFDIVSEELNIVTFVDSDSERPSRVALVPKTLKTPRIIAIEPCCMQYAQQAIARALMSKLQSYVLTSGHINFREQKINQQLALMSSSDGRLATVDLSDASDRVPVGYALQMFRSNPDLKDAIEACRSTRAMLPDGTIVPLRKFASMGSALCFPIEAMYFYTICVMALLKSRYLPVSFRNIKSCSEDIFVYGDDIIVPSNEAATVLDYLQKYNCKVNERKTFYRGNFRESCGEDVYGGHSVKPVYINTAPPKNRQQAHRLISWVSTANLLFKAGYIRTSHLLFTKVEGILGPLPSVTETSGVLGRNFLWPSVERKRFNRRYQRLEIKCWVPSPVYRTDVIGGYAALQKSLSRLETLKELSEPRDRLHLKRSALHGEVAINLRWVPATVRAGLRN